MILFKKKCGSDGIYEFSYYGGIYVKSMILQGCMCNTPNIVSKYSLSSYLRNIPTKLLIISQTTMRMSQATFLFHRKCNIQNW